MSLFYPIALGCVLLCAIAGTLLGRTGVAFGVSLAIVALGALAASQSLGAIDARVISFNGVALAFPALLALGVTRFLRLRKSPAVRFAAGTTAGVLALSTSGYLGVAVSCLWGVCP